MQYDYLIVGAGLFGAVFAREMTDAGHKCLVIDKRDHIAGNTYTRDQYGIQIHEYGAHIFHTNDRRVWDYVNKFAAFNRYTNAPVAMYQGKLYNLPFNMNTFYALWGTTTPAQAKAKIAEQIAQSGVQNPANLEEQAISLVGTELYEKLVKGYTEKQWGTSAKDLPAFIIQRLPVRYTFDNSYFNDPFQGIPVGGYTKLCANLLAGVDVRLNTDFFADRADLTSLATTTVFTGMIDQYYNYCHGALHYRSLRFEHETLATDNYQGNAVVNYTEREVPYTRIIEHKHFEGTQSDKTVITREYPEPWQPGKEPFYPVNDERNSAVYEQYRLMAQDEPGVIFGGRLGCYQYLDMHRVVAQALDAASACTLGIRT